MALKPPSWCAHAVPTRRGWVDPHTGELLKAQRISDVDLQEQRDDVKVTKVEKKALLTEAPPNHTSLEEMTEVQTEALDNQLESGDDLLI